MGIALDFIVALYPEFHGLQLPIFALANRSTVWANGPEEAAAAAVRLAESSDVYLGVCLQDHAAVLVEAARRGTSPANTRGYACTAGAMGGLWLDIDIAGPNHKSNKLPKSDKEAMDLISQMVVKPTWIVRTGGGIHGWWIFKEPWVFDSDMDRHKAAKLARSWVATAQAKAAAHGWSVDSTGDLARVMRIPGTFNRKGKTPQPITAEAVNAA